MNAMEEQQSWSHFKNVLYPKNFLWIYPLPVQARDPMQPGEDHNQVTCSVHVAREVI